MAGQSALELLLPELQRKILLQIDGFDTLYGLILASPRFYQVFRINREITLSTIAYRRFHRFAIQDALIIDRLKQLETPPFSRDTVLSYFASTSDQQRQPSKSILPLSVSMELCRLDAMLRFFLNDYAQNTLPILNQLRSSQFSGIATQYAPNDHDPYLSLSDSESGRLRRAFCRLETYRKLFARCSLDLDHNVRRCQHNPSLTIFEQGQMFFQDAPAYKIAEIACVRDYLSRRLRGVLDRVEDEIVDALRTEFHNPDTQMQAMGWDTDNGACYDYFEENECHLFTYTGKHYQKHHIEHLLSLGLSYIQKILNADGDERKNLLLRDNLDCDAQYENGFLTAALGLDLMTPPDKLYGWPKKDLDSCLDPINHAGVPPGWLWANASEYYGGLVDSAAKGLRDWGYVFWDLARLKNAGVLDREHVSLVSSVLVPSLTRV